MSRELAKDKETVKAVHLRLNDLLGIGVLLVITGVALSIGLQVQTDVKDDFGDESCAARADGYTTYNSTTGECINTTTGLELPPTAAQYNATNDALVGVGNFADRLPTIATVLVAAIIIGVLVTSFMMRR